MLLNLPVSRRAERGRLHLLRWPFTFLSGVLLMQFGTLAQVAPGVTAAGRPFVVRVPAGSAAAVAAARPAPRLEQVRAAARAVAGLAPADELVALRTETDSTGDEHAWFQQVAHGLPVEHGRLTAHHRAGLLTSLSVHHLTSFPT